MLWNPPEIVEIGVPVQCHILGYTAVDVRRALLEVARAAGVADALHFHATCSPRELLSRASEHDIGLALDRVVAATGCDTLAVAVGNG